jgi:hypothetical protein
VIKISAQLSKSPCIINPFDKNALSLLSSKILTLELILLNTATYLKINGTIFTAKGA